jgi:hypothetical protein
MGSQHEREQTKNLEKIENKISHGEIVSRATLFVTIVTLLVAATALLLVMLKR